MKKTKTAPKPQKKPDKTAKPLVFKAGDAVEFRFTEGAPRPEGDAVVLKADAVSKGRMMYLLEVKQVLVGKPDSLRNPDGELWAQDGELFKLGTRAKVPPVVPLADVRKETAAAVKEKPLAKGMPAGFKEAKASTGGALLLFRAGHVLEAFNGDAAILVSVLKADLQQRDEVGFAEINADDLEAALAKLVKAGHRVAILEQVEGKEANVVAEPSKEGSRENPIPAGKAATAAACVILHEETKGRCDLIMLAGKYHNGHRKQIMVKLLGREPKHDEYGVHDLRRAFAQAMKLDCPSEEAELERIAERCIEIVAEIDKHEQALAETGAPVIAKQVQREEAAEPAEENQASAGAANPTTPEAEEDFMAKASKKALKKTGKEPKVEKANGKPKADRGLSLLDAAHKILQGRTKPMTTKELVATARERNLWTSPAGKTPEATLSAAINTEISKKGKDSRFEKPEPGKFLAAK